MAADMVVLNKIELPDPVFDVLNRRAAAHGISVVEQAARDLANVQQREQKEEALAEAIRKDREALSAQGVYLTEAFLNEAKNWGRE